MSVDPGAGLHAALRFAEERHAGATKPGTPTPFLYHPLAVASLVLKYGGSPEQARAALLHDIAGEGLATRDELAREFGAETARLAEVFRSVELPSNGSTSWRQAREAYLARLREQDVAALFVVACEELHDGTELLHDLRYRGVDTWKRYPVHGMEVFWYFRELLQLFNARLTTDAARPLVSEFGAFLRALRLIVFEGARV